MTQDNDYETNKIKINMGFGHKKNYSLLIISIFKFILISCFTFFMVFQADLMMVYLHRALSEIILDHYKRCLRIISNSVYSDY